MGVDTNAQLRNSLFADTKKGKWAEVVEKYAKNPKAPKLKLTREGNTALHLAVIDNQEETVEKLVELIRKSEGYEKVLETANERENNPLHLAAMMGSVRMCQAIASAHGKLVDKRNKANETPLFLAVSHGNKKAFYFLYDCCGGDRSRITVNCRGGNKNEDTVLHSALRNQHLDLAFQFIYMHNEAVEWVNGEGFTPLHVLANMPTYFKSGSKIEGWGKMVYHWILVDELKPQSIETLKKKVLEEMTGEAKTSPEYNSHNFPVNYETCISLFTRLKVTFLSAVRCTSKRQTKDKKNDKDLEEHAVAADEETKNTAAFPTNYTTCVDFFQTVFLGIVNMVLEFGLNAEIKKIRRKKEKHTWSVQVMKKLVKLSSFKTYGEDGRTPMDSKYPGDEEDNFTLPYSFASGQVEFNQKGLKEGEPEDSHNITGKEAETTMLLAARNGAIEIVKEMFQHFPLAIRDSSKDKKNVVLLAAEYRQADMYNFFLKKRKEIETLFRAVDAKGNSALHLAAQAMKPELWRITGIALQMQWELKWYKYVKESVAQPQARHLSLLSHHNDEGQSADDIFEKTHVELVQKGGEWLYQTSESCSVLATLIATVAFATAVNIPGGNDEHGDPELENNKGFFMFTISSLLALCLSSTSVVMFLAILTSRFNTKDFRVILPWKLLIGLSCLYFSIIAMLISFCSGHYFLIAHRLPWAQSLLLYSLTLLPVPFILGIVQLPLYYDLLQSILRKVPKRTAHVVLQK